MAVDLPPAASAGVVLRPLRVDDLADAARLHVQVLPDGFFSQLGPRFVRRYLESYLAGPVAVALAAEVGGRRVGHLVGTVGPGHYAWTLRNRWRRLLPAALVALAHRPAPTARLLRTRLRRYVRAVARARRASAQAVEAVSPAGGPRGPAALLHVAVEPAGRGSGAGSALVRGFEDLARSAGCRSARLVTFAGDPTDGSAGAGPFYERLGWSRIDQRVDDTGRQVLVYSRHL